MTRSLTVKLGIWISSAIAGVLIVSGLIVHYCVQRALLTEFDLSLEQSCLSLAYLVETDGYFIESEMKDAEWPQFSRSDNPEFYQIYDFTAALGILSAILSMQFFSLGLIGELAVRVYYAASGKSNYQVMEFIGKGNSDYRKRAA